VAHLSICLYNVHHQNFKSFRCFEEEEEEEEVELLPLLDFEFSFCLNFV